MIKILYKSSTSIYGLFVGLDYSSMFISPVSYSIPKTLSFIDEVIRKNFK